MRRRITTLDNILPRESAVVQSIAIGGELQRRLEEMGLVAGTRVECVGRSPAGDPAAYLVRGAVIAIRADDCRGIYVETVESEAEE